MGDFYNTIEAVERFLGHTHQEIYAKSFSKLHDW